MFIGVLILSVLSLMVPIGGIVLIDRKLGGKLKRFLGY